MIYSQQLHAQGTTSMLLLLVMCLIAVDLMHSHAGNELRGHGNKKAARLNREARCICMSPLTGRYLQIMIGHSCVAFANPSLNAAHLLSCAHKQYIT